MTPLADAGGQGGRTCRDFALEARIQGKRDLSQYKACRNSDGRWSLARG